MSEDEGVGKQIVSKIIDAGLNLLTKVIPGLFGKSKTRKILDSLESQADYLQAKKEQKTKTIKTLVIVFIAVAGFVVFYFVLRKRK